jgi:hypothetical protein
MLVGGRVISGAGEPRRVVVTATDLVVVVTEVVVGPDKDWIVELGARVVVADRSVVVVIIGIVVVLTGREERVGAIVLGSVLGSVDDTAGGTTTTPVGVVGKIELGHGNA